MIQSLENITGGNRSHDTKLNSAVDRFFQLGPQFDISRAPRTTLRKILRPEGQTSSASRTHQTVLDLRIRCRFLTGNGWEWRTGQCAGAQAEVDDGVLAAPDPYHLHGLRRPRSTLRRRAHSVDASSAANAASPCGRVKAPRGRAGAGAGRRKREAPDWSRHGRRGRVGGSGTGSERGC